MIQTNSNLGIKNRTGMNGLCPKMWHTRKWWQTIIYDFGRTLQTWTTHAFMICNMNKRDFARKFQTSQPLAPAQPCLCTGGSRTKTQPGLINRFPAESRFFPRKSWASHFWPTYLCNQGGFFLITGWINRGNCAVQSAGFQFYKYNSRAGPSVLVMSAVTWWNMRNRNLNTNREKRM